MIDFEAVDRAPVANEPFSYFLAEKVLTPQALAAIKTDFPSIHCTGVFPAEDLDTGPSFAALIEEIRSRPFAQLIERKVEIPLQDKPLMITVRGRCHARDGKIHTDSKDKIVTGLLYLNDPDWAPAGGRLRLLRSGTDLDDMLVEVPPTGGTMAVFKRSSNSWHGHYPYEGERRYVMFNWLASDLALLKNTGRHKLSAHLKNIGLWNR
jgi:hypothetical protein